MSHGFNLICVGVLGWDVVVLPSGSKASRPGGSAVHFAASAAMVGGRPIVIGEADLKGWAKVLEAMHALGVDVSRVSNVASMASFELHYTSDFSVDIDRFVIRSGDLRAHDRRVSALSDVLDSAAEPFVFICPNDVRCALEYTRTSLDAGARIGIQVHMSQLRDDVVAVREIISEASFIFFNEAELLVITDAAGLADATEKAKQLTSATWVVTTRRTVTVLSVGGDRTITSMLAPDVDPTGAGDALAGGVVGALAQGIEFRQAIRLGILCATANVTGIGSSNLLRTAGTISGEELTGMNDEQWSDTRTLLTGLRAYVHEFGMQRGWQRGHSARSLVDAMVVEVAELMEQFLWLSDRESDALSLQRKGLIGPFAF